MPRSRNWSPSSYTFTRCLRAPASSTTTSSPSIVACLPFARRVQSVGIAFLSPKVGLERRHVLVQSGSFVLDAVRVLHDSGDQRRDARAVVLLVRKQHL